MFHALIKTIAHRAGLTRGRHAEKVAIHCPMRNIVIILACVLITMAAHGEDEKVKVTTEMAVEAQKKVQMEQERAKASLEKKQVTYSGFLPEAARAEKKSKFFSLRQPRRTTNDVENVSFDERSGRPRGFVLFRLGF